MKNRELKPDEIKVVYRNNFFYAGTIVKFIYESIVRYGKIVRLRNEYALIQCNSPDLYCIGYADLKPIR